MLYSLRTILSEHKVNGTLTNDIDPVISQAFGISASAIRNCCKSQKAQDNIYIMIYNGFKEIAQQGGHSSMQVSWVVALGIICSSN